MLLIFYRDDIAAQSIDLSLGYRGPNENELHNFYKLVHKFEDEPERDALEGFLEKVFQEMQAEVWCPQDRLIDSLGLQHTSMSVNDLVFDDKSKTLWRVAGVGFKRHEVRDMGSEELMDGDEIEGILPIHDASKLEFVQTSRIEPLPLTPLQAWMEEPCEDWVF